MALHTDLKLRITLSSHLGNQVFSVASSSKVGTTLPSFPSTRRGFKALRAQAMQVLWKAWCSPVQREIATPKQGASVTRAVAPSE